jgi:hypothetical protein
MVLNEICFKVDGSDYITTDFGLEGRILIPGRFKNFSSPQYPDGLWSLPQPPMERA